MRVLLTPLELILLLALPLEILVIPPVNSAGTLEQLSIRLASRQIRYHR